MLDGVAELEFDVGKRIQVRFDAARYVILLATDEIAGRIVSGIGDTAEWYW